MSLEQRWRYQKRDGTPVWLRLDPDFLCIYCDEPVRALSMGGPAVCSTCDCGINKTTGKHWDLYEAAKMYRHANKRLDDMPHDPAWDTYEASHRASLQTQEGKP